MYGTERADHAHLNVGIRSDGRRSELANLLVEEISAHDRGLVLSLPRSKTNQRGEEHELVVLPRAGRRAHCPVTAAQTWMDTAGIADGPVFRKISQGTRVLDRALHPESINDLVQAAIQVTPPVSQGVALPRLRRCSHSRPPRSTPWTRA